MDGTPYTIPLAPAGSQEAIKELGTNGGGVFNANSAHPFENPNALTNLFEIFLLLVIPVSLTRTFGTMVGDRRQGVVLVAVMGVIWAAFLAVAWASESHPNGPAALAAGAAMEGKEVRFGVPGVGPLRGVDDGHLDRRGQLPARQLHRRRGRDHAAQHAARGGRARRGRHRAVRHPRARDHRGLPGRADGRPHPGVPGQEARAGGGHRGGGRDPRHADAGPARRGPGDRAPRHDQRA